MVDKDSEIHGRGGVMVLSRYHEEEWSELLELSEGLQSSYGQWKAENDAAVAILKKMDKHIVFFYITADDLREIVRVTGKKTTPNERADILHRKFAARRTN